MEYYETSFPMKYQLNICFAVPNVAEIVNSKLLETLYIQEWKIKNTERHLYRIYCEHICSREIDDSPTSDAANLEMFGKPVSALDTCVI